MADKLMLNWAVVEYHSSIIESRSSSQGPPSNGPVFSSDRLHLISAAIMVLTCVLSSFPFSDCLVRLLSLSMRVLSKEAEGHGRWRLGRVDSLRLVTSLLKGGDVSVLPSVFYERVLSDCYWSSFCSLLEWADWSSMISSRILIFLLYITCCFLSSPCTH